MPHKGFPVRSLNKKGAVTLTRPRKFVRKGVLPSLRVVWQEKKFASLTKSFLTDDLPGAPIELP